MPGSAPVAAVTGAGGYLGGAVARTLEARGFSVLRLSRAGGDGFPAYRLESPPAPGEFASREVAALIHCAYDFTLRDPEDVRRVNVDGSLRLFEAARDGGVEKRVFVSSLSAFDGCVTDYGRAKRAVELDVLRSGGAVVRPGMIYGGRTGGIMGKIASQILSRRVVPALSHPGALYATHVEDLASCLADLAAGTAPLGARPLFCAGKRPWSLPEIVAATAEAAHRDVSVARVPWRLVWLAMKAAETAGLRPAFRSDSVLSLGHLMPPDELGRMDAPARAFREFDASALAASKV
jgi:NADH dehydrogenase